MPKTIIISNRLPVSITIADDKKILISESIGGLATGLKSVHAEENSLWIGWSAIESSEVSPEKREEIDRTLLKKYRCLSVHLDQNEIDNFYYGYCNKTIWPLFHYFPNMTTWEHKHWEVYGEVNRKFYNAVAGQLSDGDTIWVHDYQLMLLPEMIRAKHPNVKIGFFLHIPFPSYEIFRLLPRREAILNGILGADLIGFHTYDYVRHFFSSARRLLGYENAFGKINLGNRLSKVDAFPMGIDYERYNKAGRVGEIKEGTHKLLEETSGKQVVLSVDRLDYTKGIPERIRAFSHFLELNPYYAEKVHLIIIAAPSRTALNSYNDLKREVEELVSEVNGKHGKIGWMPVWFFYQTFTFSELAALYRGSDVMLVTPLRDGMNLVVKEYIACRKDYRGIVVLSETAGASSELSETLSVNPNDSNAIAAAIKEGLEMPVNQQIHRNKIMHERLKRYTVKYWAEDFLQKLDDNDFGSLYSEAIWIKAKDSKSIVEKYQASKKRLLIFDYDGTLTPLCQLPGQAKPTAELLQLLRNVTKDPKTTLLICSGRTKEDMDNWFGALPIDLSAEHGIWIRRSGQEWEQHMVLNDEWKKQIRPVIESYVDRTPKSFIEEKTLGMAWHYRRCEPDQANVRLNDLRDTLMEYIQNENLCLLDGSKVLEVRDVNASKGNIVNLWLQKDEWDFIVCAGDDVTDEEMFSVMPERAFSIKVGTDSSAATYHVKDCNAIIDLLSSFEV
ncbi:MAG: bifunctional alpha,alpha-trehalose-phosphate synthase (UDP-forming)/trehalose-phosphatase [Kiritimatiellae bacterium]|jgi:trehalose 6-phosphate synthase/phosphatase|nr:bifunctional alpha,alpha-trehalose-phosphate synthase (UDP-forming)/trehalose-phosphatase [Kiritimatiellia bacterium]